MQSLLYFLFVVTLRRRRIFGVDNVFIKSNSNEDSPSLSHNSQSTGPCNDPDNNNNKNSSSGDPESDADSHKVQDLNGNTVSPSQKESSTSHPVDEFAGDGVGRLELLEEALKESIALTVQAELQVRLKDEALTTANSKINALESALASSLFRLSCPDCPALRQQIHLVSQTLSLLRDQRNQHLEDIFDLKLEALSTALSDIDEQAARLEMSSRPEDRQTLADLRAEREELRRRIAEETERRVACLAQMDHDLPLANRWPPHPRAPHSHQGLWPPSPAEAHCPPAHESHAATSHRSRTADARTEPQPQTEQQQQQQSQRSSTIKLSVSPAGPDTVLL